MRRAISAPAEVEVFIRLDTPSVSELNIQALQTTGAFASREAQQRQAALVDAEQASFRGSLASFGATELSAQRVGANGLRVRVPAGEIENLRNLPGVRSVGRVETHVLDNVTSVPWIGAVRAAQQFGLTGAGVTVGIIDTGIDYTHANFGGPGTPAAYSGNDKNVVEPGTFPTAKVAGGFDFAGPTYSASEGAADPTPDPDPDPLDGNGHGSHVAGTAAGIGVPGTIGAGVAPEATLYALKVFGDVAGSTNLTSLAIEWAMDPNGDGCMEDHLDVINMSLGSPLGEPDDPSAISTDNATAVGIIVATSSGNEGPVPYVTGAPGVAASAISTAATNPGGRDNDSRINVTAPASLAGFKDNIEGVGPVLLQNVGPLSGTVVEAAPLNGCGALSNGAAVNNNIALVIRGTCNFNVKYNFAAAAGARAIVVYNDGLAPDRIFPLAMAAPGTTIPGIMISFTDGSAINAVATTDSSSPVQATLDVGTDPTDDDQIASFTSRGPGSSGNSSFKPDVSAPGLAIVSTGVGSGNGPAPNQGTSMASPHVAGAAALLRERFPRLKPAAIKALLQNSSVPAINTSDTDLARQGVGVIRVDEAARLSSYASPGGISFGRLNPTSTIQVERRVELNNLGWHPRFFSVTHVPNQTYPGVTVSCPHFVVVGSRDDRDFKVRLRFDPTVAPAAGIFDNAIESQAEVDGWCVLDDGRDTLRVGYLAVVDSASRMEVQKRPGNIERVRNKGPAVGFAEAFTFVSKSSTSQRGTYASIDALGVRRADPALFAGAAVLELGLRVDEPWEHISNLEIDVFLDANKDGTDDIQLQVRDLSAYFDVDPGTDYVTAQFSATAGFLDWIVGWDFNDKVVSLPFTLASDTVFGGLVPDSFSYRLVLRSRDGTVDEQTGEIDLADEVVPDLNSFGLAAGEEVDISKTGNGRLLWLFPNNSESSWGDHDHH
jgi:subtilisin family serine protease